MANTDLDDLLTARGLGADLPLRSLRTPMRQCRFATISHSFEAGGQLRVASGSGWATVADPRGSHFWLHAMMGPGRFAAPYMASGKHSGQPTSVMAADANLSAFIAECKLRKINTVLWIGVVNDPIATLAQTDAVIANIGKIAKAVTDAGMYFLVTDDLPAGQGSSSNYTRSADQLAGLGRIQRWCLHDLPFANPMVIPVPIYGLFVSRIGATGVPADATCFSAADMMHPSIKGHCRYALEIYRVLDRLFPPRPGLCNVDNGSAYSATLNKRGSLIGNPMLAGDSSGLATGWSTGGTAGGATIALSKLTDPDGTPVQQIALSGTATAAGGISLQRGSGASNFDVGDKHAAECFILIKAAATATGYVNFRGAQVEATCVHQSPTASYKGLAGNVVASDPYPADLDWGQFNNGRGLWFRTPEEEIGSAWPATSAYAQLNISVNVDAAGPVDIVMQVRQADWRKTYAVTGF